tara:strand:- start:3572 stop:4717 length:1146 start_codon:yes stop_codon:yes gene_type:complete
MITLNQLISLYQDIGSRHKQVNDFMAVQDFNIEMDRAPTYPLLVVNPVSANMPKSEGGYTVFNTTLELQVLDLVNKDNNNRMDVMSDTQQIIADIITEFSTHPYYMDNSIDTISDISFDPIRGAYGGDVDGWKISITLEHPVKLSYCSAPVENIQGFDFSAPNKVTVTDGENPNSPLELYGGDTYTCISVEPKAGIQYRRPMPTGQTTSYALFDDAWQVANNPYPAAPSNPLYCQGLVDFYTLNHNNAFGNTDRFTDKNGLQVYGNGVFIDNLTGLMWSDNRYFLNVVFNDALTNANSATLDGYTDWKIPNISESEDLIDRGKTYSNRYLDVPFNYGTRVMSSTTSEQNPLTILYPYFFDNRVLSLGKTALVEYAICRIHF